MRQGYKKARYKLSMSGEKNYTIKKGDAMYVRYTFLSNHSIHESLGGLCFWASDPIIEQSW